LKSLQGDSSYEPLDEAERKAREIHTLFDEAGEYREIATGFRGCHGAKLFGDRLYLSDSAAGTVLYLDRATGRIGKRLFAGTRWLHDADHIDQDTVAVSLGDCNEVRLIDSRSGEVLQAIGCDAFGESVMFVSTFDVSAGWSEKYQPEIRQAPKRELRQAAAKGPELLASIMNYRGWSLPGGIPAQVGSMIRTTADAEQAYLLVGNDIRLARGRYCLSAELVCHQGAVMLGLLDIETDKWMASAIFDAENTNAVIDIPASKAVSVRPVVAAADANDKSGVAVELIQLSLRKYVRRKRSRTESASKNRAPRRQR